MPCKEQTYYAHVHLIILLSHFPKKITEFTALLQRLIDTYELVTLLCCYRQPDINIVNLFRSTNTPSDELLSCTSLFLGLLESLCSPLPQSMNNKVKSEFEEKVKLEPDMEEQSEKPSLLENITLSRTVCLPAKLVKTVYTETSGNKLEKLISVIKVSNDLQLIK